jgi:hypothetical protein
MSLIGFRYVQASDPGAVGAGYQWYNTSSGIVYERNTTNTGWVSIGNANSTSYGLLPLSGGTMTGAIAGVSGWAPETSPDFNTSAKLEGVNLATTNDLSTLQTNLEDYVDAQVASALASQGVTSEVASNTAIQTGTLKGATATTAVTIPLPVFSDGQTATEAQCKWIVSIRDAKTGDTADAYYLYFRDSTDSAAADPTAVRTFCAYTAKSDRSLKVAAGIQYMIIARR